MKTEKEPQAQYRQRQSYLAQRQIMLEASPAAGDTVDPCDRENWKSRHTSFPTTKPGYPVRNHDKLSMVDCSIKYNNKSKFLRWRTKNKWNLDKASYGPPKNGSRQTLSLLMGHPN